MVTVCTDTPRQVKKGMTMHGLKAVMLSDRKLTVIDEYILANPDAKLDKSGQVFLDRQAAQLTGGAMKRERMQEAYWGFLTLMEDQLKHALFLFGNRPSLAEFGIYGQMTQYAVDPTVCAMLKERAVRSYQWTHFTEDVSGIEGEWAEPNE